MRIMIRALYTVTTSMWLGTPWLALARRGAGGSARAGGHWLAGGHADCDFRVKWVASELGPRLLFAGESESDC